MFADPLADVKPDCGCKTAPCAVYRCTFITVRAKRSMFMPAEQLSGGGYFGCEVVLFRIISPKLNSFVLLEACLNFCFKVSVCSIQLICACEAKNW